MKTVKVAKVPGVAIEVALPDEATVADALEAYGESTEGYDVRLGDVPAAADTVLEDGARLYLVKQIKGN